MIVAFLQNPWFPAGTSMTVVTKYRDNQDFHKRLLGHTQTGRRLINSFGAPLFEKIHWDNANWRHVTSPKLKLPADPEHIRRVILLKNPDLILSFGRVATDAVKQLPEIEGRNIMECPHPSAFGHMCHVLNKFVKELREKYPNLVEPESV